MTSGQIQTDTARATTLLLIKINIKVKADTMLSIILQMRVTSAKIKLHLSHVAWSHKFDLGEQGDHHSVIKHRGVGLGKCD